jgi:hypothetical protein
MKHIFIGIDGTSQSAFYDKFHSNVYRMDLSLAFKDREQNPQLFIYFSGVGASGFHYFGLWGRAFGQGIDEIILQAYVNLVCNYEPGDKIYIFGFSRGAVAARALSGLISRSGLVRYDSSPMIESAWRYFVSDPLGFNYQDIRPKVTHDNVQIEFVGVWDTVYGINTKKALKKSPFTRLRFRDFLLDRSVRNAIHIISIDDRRKYFQPMLWDGCNTAQRIEQIWMLGVHADVGGGYEKSFISTVSLLSMIDKLSQYCPDVDWDEHYIKTYLLPVLEDSDIVINDERKGYIAFTDFGQTRLVDNGLPALNQSVHPLTEAMTDKNILFKEKMCKYTPSYVMSRKDLKLAGTGFDQPSYYHMKVEPALKAKLGT